jgi:hypothetical protein
MPVHEPLGFALVAAPGNRDAGQTIAIDEQAITARPRIAAARNGNPAAGDSDEVRLIWTANIQSSSSWKSFTPRRLSGGFERHKRD